MSDITTISARQDSLFIYLRKIWEYRSLTITFAKRDLKVKYAQTFLGVSWILVQPIPSILFFTFFFGYMIKMDTGALPYPVFALTGMIGWSYFTTLSTGIGNSLIESQHILKKIYFPKLILPLSKVLVAAVDFLVSFLLVIIAMLAFSVYPGWQIIFFPLFFFLNILTGLCIGLWVSSLTFRYRDFQNVAPAILGFFIWLTPVFYSTTFLPKKLNYIMYLNPMAFVIEGYRFTLVGERAPSPYFLISVIPVLLLFVLGLLYFRKIEDEIAEFI